MLLHLFVMKSTTMGATKKDDFLKPEMTYSGNRPLFGECCGGKGAIGGHSRSPWSLPPYSCVKVMSLFRVSDLFELCP